MKKSILLALFILSILLSHATITPTHLRCEYLSNPPVIDLLHPRLSWINTADPGERGPNANELRDTGSEHDAEIN